MIFGGDLSWELAGHLRDIRLLWKPGASSGHPGYVSKVTDSRVADLIPFKSVHVAAA
jgi:hypothetical protein